MVIVDIKPIFGKADFTINDKLAFIQPPMSLRELDRRLDDFKEKRLSTGDSIHTTSIDRLITELRQSYTS